MLNRLLKAGLVTMVVMGMTATAALAVGVPDPIQSTMDDMLMTCPAGDISFSVRVLDIAGLPVPGALVEINFCDCEEAILCLYAGGQACGNGKNDLLMTTADVNGNAIFYPAAGGICGGATVAIIADGVELGRRPVLAMDVDGNFIVEIADFTYDPVWNDYTGDGFSNLADYAVFASHGQHTCDAPVGSEYRTWGGIKSLWR